MKLREKLEYEDLCADGGSLCGPVLRLKGADRYLHGPTPAQAITCTNVEDMAQQQQAVRQEVHNWTPSYKQVGPQAWLSCRGS